jgi:hypothetical protein
MPDNMEEKVASCPISGICSSTEDNRGGFKEQQRSRDAFQIFR